MAWRRTPATREIALGFGPPPGISTDAFANINNFVYNYSCEKQRVQALAGRSGSNIHAGERVAPQGHRERQEFCFANARQEPR